MEISTSNSKHLTALIIAIIILIWGIALFLVNRQYSSKYDDYVAYRNETFDNAIDSVVRVYENFSNFIFASAIDNDRIKAYLYVANYGDEEERAKIRKQLAVELRETHELITKHNFRQFHFQLANGDSFYRFHNPGKYGDNLLIVRESMRIANLEHRYVTGFEEGRIFSGYRFVYPLNYKGYHSGSIEISISPQCILDELYSLDSNRDLGFILSKSVMEETVFLDEQARYKTCHISEEYVYDVEILAINEARQDGLKLHQEKAFQAKLRKLIEKDLRTKAPITLAMDFDGKTYLVQYRPIKDISQQPVGYFFSYKEDRQIQAFAMSRKIVAILATVIMLILILLVAYMHRSQREIQRMAMTDNLTSVYNRHSFYALAGREIARADRTGEPLSIAMVDIDFFKKVNDNFGHAMGDQVLKTAAGQIKDNVRKTDVLARYGGEEFIVLLPSTGAKDAYIVAERIRNCIEGYRFEKMGGITVSIGLSERVDKEIIDDVINKADTALYKAKEAGRNRTVVYE